jgi:hypothetical protein
VEVRRAGARETDDEERCHDLLVGDGRVRRAVVDQPEPLDEQAGDRVTGDREPGRVEPGVAVQ